MLSASVKVKITQPIQTKKKIAYTKQKNRSCYVLVIIEPRFISYLFTIQMKKDMFTFFFTIIRSAHDALLAPVSFRSRNERRMRRICREVSIVNLG